MKLWCPPQNNHKPSLDLDSVSRQIYYTFNRQEASIGPLSLPHLEKIALGKSLNLPQRNVFLLKLKLKLIFKVLQDVAVMNE